MKSAATSRRDTRQPFVGALLRLAYQIARKHQLQALKQNGFEDLNQALLSVMVYPHPDGVRPSDLAERINMTKQATNYLLGQLEALGYVERKAVNGSSRRLVFLTRRGWQSIEVHRKAVLDLEAKWAKAVGQKRFDQFKQTLSELVALEAADGDSLSESELVTSRRAE